MSAIYRLLVSASRSRWSEDEFVRWPPNVQRSFSLANPVTFFFPFSSSFNTASYAVNLGQTQTFWLWHGRAEGVATKIHGTIDSPILPLSICYDLLLFNIDTILRCSGSNFSDYTMCNETQTPLDTQVTVQHPTPISHCSSCTCVGLGRPCSLNNASQILIVCGLLFRK